MVKRDGSDGVSVIKRLIHAKEGISVQEQLLCYGSRQMEDGKTLQSYDIKEGRTIDLQV